MRTVHNRRTRYRRTDMPVVPGLIDSHSHAVQYLTKGVGDDVYIFDWMYKRVNPYEAHVTPDDAYISGLGSFVEAIKTGTTCINDPGRYHVDRIAEAPTRVSAPFSLAPRATSQLRTWHRRRR